MNKIVLVLILLITRAATAQTFTNELEIPDLLTGPNFELTIKQSQKEFIQGTVTQTYSYNNMNYLGPTLIFNKGETVNFNITNTINENATVHWHGFHIPAEWDGGPQNLIEPNTTWSPTYEVMEHASTMWYHSHVHGNTADQVGKGMAGMIIIRDDEEAALDLPRTYGVDDIPLIIQDKNVDNNGQIQVANLGNTMMVNGTLSPYMDAPAQVIRFRMLNASLERTYNIGLSDNRNYKQIGTDGGLLEAPVELNRVRIAPGERAEILIDLSGESAGSSLYLMSYGTELGQGVAGAFHNGPGGGDGPLDSTDFQIMELKISEQTSGAITNIPASLVNIDFIDTGVIDTIRTKRLLNPSSPGAPFSIDGVLFDANVVNDTVMLGATEIWRFVNTSSLAHPMHIHDVQFNLLSRNGNDPADNEKGWKDVVFVYPDETVDVVAKFDDFADSVFAYMFHCHLLTHEDRGMMQRFIVVDPAWYETTSIAKYEKAESRNIVSYYPSPVRGMVNFNLNGRSNETNIKVYNILGELIESKSFFNIQTPHLNLSNLASGFYVISLDIDGRQQVLKMIKK